LKRFRIYPTIGVVFLATAISQCFAGSKISLPLQLKQSSKAEIEYRLVKEKNGTSREARIIGALEILLLTNDGFKASWTTESVEVGGVVYGRSSRLAASLLLGIPIRFIGNKDGLPINLYDRELLIKSITKNEVFSKLDAAAVKKTVNFLVGLTDEVAAQLFLKVPSYISICQGTNLEEGVLQESREQLPNPLGNAAIDSDVTYKLSAMDNESNTATIEYRSRFNPESLKTTVEHMMAKLASDVKKSTKEIDAFVLSRRDTADCIVDTNTGSVKTMTYSTEIKVAEKSQSERYEISVQWRE